MNTKDLYYKQQSNQTSYTIQEQKTIAFDRLAAGKSDFWIKQNGASTKLCKKTLIITDWTLWSVINLGKNLFFNQISLCLNKLFADGFVIYFWSDGELFRLYSEGMLINPIISKHITLASPQAIMSIAIQTLKQSQHQIYLLDDYAIQKLMGNIDNGRFIISDSIITQYEALVLKDNLVKFVNESYPKIETLMKHSCVGDEYLKDFNFIKTEEYRVLKWETSYCRNAENLEINSSYLVNSDYDYSNIRLLKITIDDNHNIDSLLRMMPMLESLEILGSYNDDNCELVTRVFLPNLKKLILVELNLSGKSFNDLLQLGPINCLELHNVFTKNEPKLYLDKLNLNTFIFNRSESSNSSIDLFAEILCVNEQLIYLDFNGYSKLSTKALAAMRSLKGLDYSGSSEELLIKILHHTPELSLLNIDIFCPMDDDLDNVTEEIDDLIYLSDLKFLCICCEISFINLLIIPELRSLVLKDTYTDNRHIQMYPKLKTLEINNVTCNTSFITYLFEHIPSVKEIVFKNLDLHGDRFRLKLLSNVYKFSFHLSETLNSVYFKWLFSALPNITHFELKLCKKCNFDIDFSKIVNLAIINEVGLNNQDFLLLLSKLHVQSSGLQELFFSRIPELTITEKDYLLQHFAKQLVRNNLNDILIVENHTPSPAIELIAAPMIECRVDANTKLKTGMTYKIQKIFYATTDDQRDPEVSTYRQTLYDTLLINEQHASINDAFILKNQYNHYLDLVQVDKEELYCTDDVFDKAEDFDIDCVYGKQILLLDNTWQALASLTPNDELLCYHIEPNNIQIAYSDHNRLYYVRSTGYTAPQYVVIDFLISKQDPILPSNELKGMVDELRAYKTNELQLSSSTLTGIEFLNALKTQQTGACRHRAIVLKSILDSKDFSSRVILNHCHAFVEVLIDDQWITCDLGGYPASFVLNETSKPKIKKSEPTLLQLYYRNLLETWIVPVITDKHEYLAQIFSSDIQRRLICLKSTDSSNVSLLLQKEALKYGKRVFCINHPDQLTIGGPYLRRTEENFGVWSRGGGELYDVIHETSSMSLVLIFNFQNFSIENIIQCNSGYGSEKTIDNVRLPDDTMIIGLVDPDSFENKLDDSFYSRFLQVESYPFHEEESESILQPLREEMRAQNRVVINLYHSMGWKIKLFGGWVIKDNVPRFQTGFFQQALDSGLPIEFLNPPEDSLFKDFWHTAKLHKKIIYHGIEFKLPENLVIWFNDRFVWDDIITYGDVSEHAQVLNPSTVQSFISRYDTHAGKITCASGILDTYNIGDTLELLMTREVDDDALDFIIDHCRQKQLSITLKRAEVITCELSCGKTRIIYAADRDLALHVLTKTITQSHVIIDCSAYTASDLIEKLSVGLTGEVPNISFNFFKQEQVILKELNKDRLVILVGKLCDDLVDALALLCIHRSQEEHVFGQLIIITEQPLVFLPNEIPSYDKYAELLELADAETLKHLAQEIPDYLTNCSFVECKTRLAYLKSNPLALRSQEIYRGFDQVALTKPSVSLDLLTDKTCIVQHNNVRYQTLMQVFAYSPYVFVAGLTGIGKSHFMMEYLAKLPEYVGKVFFGIESATLKQWLQTMPHEDGLVILFVDEANFNVDMLSIFEGLFFANQQLIIEDQVYPVTSKHKIIFAGNPLSYGEKREMAPLFKRHGASIVWEPLSIDVMAHALILPLLEKMSLESQLKCLILQDLIKEYKFFIQIAVDEIKISARQIQMILMMTSCLISSTQTVDINDQYAIFKFYCDEILEPLKPYSKLTTRAPRPTNCIYKLPKVGPLGHYYMPSRVVASQKMFDFFNLRNFLNYKQCYSGLNRLVITGDSGIGKSQWIQDLLVMFRIEYYTLSATSTLTERKNLLLKAFDEGAIVLIDEINTIASMEEWLNYLLDGKHPEEGSRRPHKCGFRLIGTQNPETLAGRNVVESEALKNRTLLINLEKYTTQEIFHLSYIHGLQKERAPALALAYEYNLQYAKDHDLRKQPTLRHVLNIVNEERRSLVGVSRRSETFFTSANQAVEDVEHRNKSARFV